MNKYLGNGLYVYLNKKRKKKQFEGGKENAAGIVDDDGDESLR